MPVLPRQEDGDATEITISINKNQLYVSESLESGSTDLADFFVALVINGTRFV